MNNQEIEKITFKGTEGRDEFCREQVADKVIQLLTADIEVSPMVIDGDWGTGKTEFCHKLINKFRDEHITYKLLYVDAFQADHADNPLLTVLSGVMSLLPEGRTKKTLLQKAIPVIRFATATAGKAVFSHVFKQNADDLAEGLETRLQGAADQAIDATVKTLLKDHEDATKNIQALQATLEIIAENAPIVIFIDELDRCRPDFAVQMLEIIKHTFNVNGVQFVLVTNTRQLKAAINHRYGHQVDAQRYLDKFLKFSFRLPDFVVDNWTHESDRISVSIKYFLQLLKKNEFLKKTKLVRQGDSVLNFTKSLMQQNALSLREVETFVRYLSIYQKLSQGLRENINLGNQLLKIFSIFIFCFKPDISITLENNNADADKLAEILGVFGLPDCISSNFRLSHLQNVAVLLAQDSAINSEKYFPADEKIEEKIYWKDRRESYFPNSWSRPDNMHEPVKEVIRCLQLGNIY